MNLFFDPFTFWMIFSRLSGFIVIAPGIYDMRLPVTVKAAFVIWLTITMIGGIPSQDLFFTSWLDGLIMIFSEFLLGLGLGFSVRLIFGGIQLGGMLIDNELGLSAVDQLLPNLSLSGGVFGRLFLYIALALFWILDYFSLLILSIHETFSLLPIGVFPSSVNGIESLMRFAGELFSSGILIAAPVIMLIFCVTVSLGFLSKSVQGINIFFESFTLRVAVGLSGVIFLLPLFLFLIRKELENIIPNSTEYIQMVFSS